MLRVIIVDGQPLVRAGLRTILQAAGDITVVAEGADGSEALRLVAEHAPDVLVLAENLPGPLLNSGQPLDSVTVTRRLQEQNTTIAILVLTASFETPTAYELLKAGGTNYLLKDDTPATLVDAVRAAARGDGGRKLLVTRQLSPPTMGQLEAATLLTPREIEVLSLLAQGLDNTAIAEHLILTKRTVQNHISNIYSKLGCVTRTEAALYAIRHGLLAGTGPDQIAAAVANEAKRMDVSREAARPVNPLSWRLAWRLVAGASLIVVVVGVLLFLTWFKPGVLPTSGAPAPAIRPMPETTDGIYVFNDQLAGESMTEAQFEFAATHYVGAQKLLRTYTDHLRAYNPNFIVLNYRLGLSLGYRKIEGACEPTGPWLEIIEGNEWVREYPEAPQERWFFKWQGQRVLECEAGWYLMDVDNISWRDYWAGEVLRQLRVANADGVFADNFSVPNYRGHTNYAPPLPELDETFEHAWSARLEDFITFAQTGELAGYYFIPNVGEWINGRDITDYAAADGVMVEGFARRGHDGYFDPADRDWQLQMERILGLVRQDKIILAQQYVDPANVADRMFVLASFLLIKGKHTYINLELGPEPEWFPEYEIPLGQPEADIPLTINALWHKAWGVYARPYSNGLVLVNPTAATQTIPLDNTYYQALPTGGGFVPADGNVSAWTVHYTPVSRLTLAPNQGAVLLKTAP